MLIKDTPSYQTFLDKETEAKASQQANGFQAPETLALAKEAGKILDTCIAEAGGGS